MDFLRSHLRLRHAIFERLSTILYIDLSALWQLPPSTTLPTRQSAFFYFASHDHQKPRNLAGAETWNGQKMGVFQYARFDICDND